MAPRENWCAFALHKCALFDYFVPRATQAHNKRRTADNAPYIPHALLRAPGNPKVDASKYLTFPHSERHSHDSVSSWSSVQHTDKVGEVVQNGEIVLNNHDIPET